MKYYDGIQEAADMFTNISVLFTYLFTTEKTKHQ